MFCLACQSGYVKGDKETQQGTTGGFRCRNEYSDELHLNTALQELAFRTVSDLFMYKMQG